MHKIWIFLVCCTVISCQEPNNVTLPGSSFTLSGQVSGRDEGYVYLDYTDTTGKSLHDSAVLHRGAFTFRGQIKEPTHAFLVLDTANGTSLFLEPAVMTVALTVGDFEHANVTGSVSQKEQQELDGHIAPILEERKPLEKSYEKAGEAYERAVKGKAQEAVLDTMKERLAKMHDAFEPYEQRIAAVNYAFFASHPQSYVTANWLGFYADKMPLDSAEMFYHNLGPVVGASAAGKEIAKTIRKIKAGSPGSVAADFTTPDIQGKPLHLADFKGKYVILDFWASWCVPCRHGNPHLREVYQRYHKAGLDIISVSDDDQNTTAWRKAVEKDSIGIWHHVLRGNEPSKSDNPNDISELFGIGSLPTKILIDPQGKIVGRYDSEAGPLDTKLAEIFK